MNENSNRPVTQVLALFVLALALLLARLLATGSQAVSMLATVPKRMTVIPILKNLPSNQQAPLDALRRSPLFYAARSYYVAPPPVVPTTPPVPDYRFAGSVLDQSKSGLVILVNKTTSASRRVRIGDDLDGWAVAGVEARRVLLKVGDTQIEIGREGGAVEELQRVAFVRGNQSGSSGGIKVLGGNGSSVRGVGAFSASQSLSQLPDTAPRGRAALRSHMERATGVTGKPSKR
jgi:hypothetical protein